MSSAVIRRRMLHGELRLRGPGHAPIGLRVQWRMLMPLSLARWS